MKSSIRVLASVLTLALLGAANAAVVQRDLFADNDRLLTLDTETGLEFLDLTETTGLSVQSVLAGAGGFTALGFRLASYDEVADLWVHAGASPVGGGTTEGARVRSLQFMLGVTAGVEQAIESIGFYKTYSPTGEYTNAVSARLWTDVQCGGTCFALDTDIAYSTRSAQVGYPDHGTYLVRGGFASSDRTYDAVASVPDLNDNGTPELAALCLLDNGIPEVVIKDGRTKERLSTIVMSSTPDRPAGITPINDINGNGYPELAMLFVEPSGRGRVLIKDALTGEWVNQIRFFGPDWEAIGITAQDTDFDGISEVSVLAERDDGTRAAVNLKDAMTGDQVIWIGLPVE